MKVGTENERLEFKQTMSELDECVVSIASILNTHGYGELYFGVDNDGRALGLEITEQTIRDIDNAISGHLQPLIEVEISPVYFDEKHCIHVTFSGDDSPYRAFGKAYFRVSDQDREMSDSEIESFRLQKNGRKNTWDTYASDHLPEEVNEEALKRFWLRAREANGIGFDYGTKAEALDRLGLVRLGHAVNAASLLFCDPPELEVQMATFASAQRLTCLDIERKRGRIGELVEASVRYIRNVIKWRVVFDGSIERKEIPEIPMEAVRVALLNSYCHRDYSSGRNNEVIVFKNRIEIFNPGHFQNGVTPDSFISGKWFRGRRNPRLAELMHLTNEAGNWGLRRIDDLCEEAGVKVEFRLGKQGFTVVFYRRIDHTNEG